MIIKDLLQQTRFVNTRSYNEYQQNMFATRIYQSPFDSLCRLSQSTNHTLILFHLFQSLDMFHVIILHCLFKVKFQ